MIARAQLMSSIRIGLMGFGQVGRQIYSLALKDDRFDVVVISDIGNPSILCHLLDKTLGRTGEVQLKSNYLVSSSCRTRLMPADHPNEIPWDVFDVDVVIDATGRFRSAGQLLPHLGNGANRVITSALPVGEIDRVVLYGINHSDIEPEDRIISAGSSSTTAAALALKVLGRHYDIRHATMTSVHAYTSDQSLQDYAGADYRRSRSGAENIIPNETPALTWLQRVQPELNGKVSAYALNVPVQVGSMLDTTVALGKSPGSIQEVRALFIEAEKQFPTLIATTNDPIVSSDVKGSSKSLLVDLQGCMLAGSRMVKLLAWHETLGHAHRILDVVSAYQGLDDTSVEMAQA